MLRKAAPSARGPRPPVVSARVVLATAGRVLAQLRADHRTVALLLVVPSLLLMLTNQMFDGRPAFDRVALSLLGIFPFTTMFAVTSVAMLRERTGGTLERLLTTPMSKLDLLLGYGIAFSVAAAAQAAVTCGTAYWALGLYTPGSPWLVVATAVLDAMLGMALGLFVSAFATSEFQAVQFMPAIVTPQILLGGLFVPREAMADWLQRVSDALPLTYSIDALHEVGRTSLLTDTLLRDLGVVVGTTVVALVLGALTLRRRSGTLRAPVRAALALLPLAVAAAAGVLTTQQVRTDRAFVAVTDDARVDADRIGIVAPATGTLVDWVATEGAALRAGKPVGRIRITDGFRRPTQVVRAPADCTVLVDAGLAGDVVAAGTELAVAYDMATLRVTARVDETDVAAVHPGQAVDLHVDALPGVTLTGTVRQVRTAADRRPSAEQEAGNYRPSTQVVPVDIAILDAGDRTLVPGMNVTVRILRDR